LEKVLYPSPADKVGFLSRKGRGGFDFFLSFFASPLAGEEAVSEAPNHVGFGAKLNCR